MIYRNSIVIVGLLAICMAASATLLPQLVNAQAASVWIPSNSRVQLFDSNYGVRIQSLTNCDTIDTDANGVLSCGSDGGGGGGASSTIIKLNGTVSNTGVPTLDFGTSSGFIVTESPTDEFNISLFTTSAELASLLTDETGSSSVVFSFSPFLQGTTTASTTSNAGVSIMTPFLITDPGASGSWSTSNPFARIAWQLPNEGNSQIRTAIGPVMEATSGNSSRLGFFTTSGSGNPAERMTIGGTGNVGIGSTTPGSLLSVNGTSFFVGTTTIADSLTFGGVNGSTWASFCTSITGGAGLCDGVDDTAAGGSGLATTTTWTVGNVAIVASNSAVNSLATSSLGLLSPASIDTSAELRGILTDEAGTGPAVFASSTTLTTPTIDGATLSGAIDGGGATSFELPNAADNTVDATGECAWDTTDDQLVCGDSANSARVVAHDEFRVISVTIASTSPSFASGGLLPALSYKDGLEITQYRCWVSGGTSKVLNLTDGTNDTESITCGTSVTSDTDVATNDTFTADEAGSIESGATTGDVNYVHLEVWARIIRE